MSSLRHPRALTAAALLTTAAVLAAPATGAPPGCGLLTDPTGDVTWSGAPLPPGAPYPHSLDILSADVATDAEELRAVVRVADLEAKVTDAPTGVTFELQVTVERRRGRSTVNRRRYSFTAQHAPGQDDFFYLWNVVRQDEEDRGLQESIGIITGVFDLEASEIRMAAPLALLQPISRPRPGDRLGHLAAWSGYWLGLASPTENRRPHGGLHPVETDAARSKGVVTAGSQSCVTSS